MKKKTKIRKLLIFPCIFLLYLYIVQFYAVHRNFPYQPSHEKVDLKPILTKPVMTEDEYHTVFVQTGLSKAATDLLLSDSKAGFQKIIGYQNAFYQKTDFQCNPLCLWFVRSDCLTDEKGNPLLAPPVVDAAPGDILVSFSTHSFGWRHGHAGLVLSKNETLECRVIGENSSCMSVSHWQNYPCYALLRVKDITPAQQQAVADFAKNRLNDIPYRLTCGLYYRSCDCIGKPFFGVNCASLIWYAYDAVGIDLCPTQNRIVTPMQLLHSERIEVIQFYGMQPPSST